MLTRQSAGAKRSSEGGDSGDDKKTEGRPDAKKKKSAGNDVAKADGKETTGAKEAPKGEQKPPEVVVVDDGNEAASDAEGNKNKVPHSEDGQEEGQENPGQSSPTQESHSSANNAPRTPFDFPNFYGYPPFPQQQMNSYANGAMGTPFGYPNMIGVPQFAQQQVNTTHPANFGGYNDQHFSGHAMPPIHPQMGIFSPPMCSPQFNAMSSPWVPNSDPMGSFLSLQNARILSNMQQEILKSSTSSDSSQKHAGRSEKEAVPREPKKNKNTADSDKLTRELENAMNAVLKRHGIHKKFNADNSSQNWHGRGGRGGRGGYNGRGGRGGYGINT